MGSEVIDSELARAFAVVQGALADLGSVGVVPVDGGDALAAVRQLEVVGRQVRALQVGLVAEIDRRGLHRPDGHASAKVLVRHAARLSDGEAARRARAARALRDLPLVAAAFAAGRLGVDHVDRIALAHANPRTRNRFCRIDGQVAELAARLGYVEFDRKVTDWLATNDEDGTCDQSQRNHENRDASLIQEPDGSWHLDARCGALQGVEVLAILRRFVQAELDTDWAEARDRLGDGATASDLARGPGQRRMDALYAIFLQGAGAAAQVPGGSTVTTDIVVDHATFEREVARMAGRVPRGQELDLDLRRPDGTAYRCSTLDGHPIAPTEAVTASLAGHLRRIVVGADSVVIDVGRRRRCFTGAAQLAAVLASTHCYWPGCQVPATDCQIDHLLPWAAPGGGGGPGGTTSPANGGPLCGRHNRHKQLGFTVHRDTDGAWHVHRPDGSEIT